MEWSWLIGFDAKGRRAGDTNLDVLRRTVHVVVVKELLNWAAPDAAADAMAEDRHVRLKRRPHLGTSTRPGAVVVLLQHGRYFIVVAGV